MTPCPCDTLKAGEEEIMEGRILLRGVLGLRACWLAWLKGGTTCACPGVGGSLPVSTASGLILGGGAVADTIANPP